VQFSVPRIKNPLDKNTNSKKLNTMYSSIAHTPLYNSMKAGLVTNRNVIFLFAVCLLTEMKGEFRLGILSNTAAVFEALKLHYII
jgi:hypothetical protein